MRQIPAHLTVGSMSNISNNVTIAIALYSQSRMRIVKTLRYKHCHVNAII